jgi:transcription-repair coupling factor (superfamily II helicase)
MNQNQEKISWSQVQSITIGRSQVLEIGGLNATAAVYAAAAYFRSSTIPMVIVADTPKEVGPLLEQVGLFLRGTQRPLLHFPAYNVTAFKPMAYHNETAAHRIRTLYQLIEGPRASLTVTSTTALAQRLVPKNELVGFCELIAAGEEIDRDDLIRKLIAGGYTRATIVEEYGDFSLRGGILDVFSPLDSDPLRIEFFGDTVDSIRYFSADNQRTLRSQDEAVLLPAREAILQPEALQAVLGRLRLLASEVGMPVTQVRQIVDQIKNEGIFAGIENLLPLIYPQLDTFFDYVAPETLFVLMEPGQLAGAAETFEDQTRRSYDSARGQHRLCSDPSQLYLTWDQIKAKLSDFPQAEFKTLALEGKSSTDASVPHRAVYQARMQEISEVSQAIKAAQSSERPFQPLVHWLDTQKSAGLTTFIVCRRPSNLERLARLMDSYGVPGETIDSMSEAVFGRGRIYLMYGIIEAGFIWPEGGIALICDQEIFGTAYRSRMAADRPKASELLSFEDLKQDDWVVHADHGIGQYGGLIKLTLEGSVNDFLLIRYRDDDKLYLPVERMNQVQKYMGVDGVAPVMDKMGGKTWERVKRSVKRTTERMAGELLKLYAARSVQQGHAFGEVDTYFQGFEEGFPYEETTDQLKAIKSVLDDMRRKNPMDRLVCGDVGYGKTEVALRAAFLAVSEAKQVALLVPTTVLAEQHYATFCERFQRYPVKISCLSRFRPAKEQREMAASIKSGGVDIAIGTHRLLQKDIEFKDLGLLVLDEEQRFGVRHKEKIKKMRKTVDVLTLTATPIPRTLHLSLMGIRDISIINTPPEQRRPITTYLTEYDDLVAAEAIRKELARKGQVFFVHNNIHSIERMAGRLAKLVPEVRLAVAHGRMPESQLERVMLDFSEQRIDLLVCTTIIESGLDVTKANTILINRADRFGLAQIYQLRGRVGRGDEQAYAYLFIPSESLLTKDAQKRLKVLMEHSDLGSGFQIAMSDLKIRGGGTILGASQSGHIAAVGYDMFLKLMESSIAEIKGEPIQEELEPEIHLPLSAFLPETYVLDIDQRLSLYRRLAKMRDLKELTDLKGEMADRFGRLPQEADNLLIKMMIRILAIRAGCRRLDLADYQLRLQFSEAHQVKPFGIVEMIRQGNTPYRFTPDHLFKTQLTPGSTNSQLAQVKKILIEIAHHVNH